MHCCQDTDNQFKSFPRIDIKFLLMCCIYLDLILKSITPIIQLFGFWVYLLILGFIVFFRIFFILFLLKFNFLFFWGGGFIPFKNTNVCTKKYQGYYWAPKMGQNRIISSFYAQRATDPPPTTFINLKEEEKTNIHVTHDKGQFL